LEITQWAVLTIAEPHRAKITGKHKGMKPLIAKNTYEKMMTAAAKKLKKMNTADRTLDVRTTTIKPTTLNVGGDIDILQMHLYTENEAASSRDSKLRA